jgi:hypothetical protein
MKMTPEGIGSRPSHLLYIEPLQPELDLQGASLSSSFCPESYCTDMRQLQVSKAGSWL